MTPSVVAILAFASVALVIFVFGQHMLTQAVLRRRLPTPEAQAENRPSNAPRHFLHGFIGRIDERKFGIEGTLRSKLRREMLKAGYFSDEAIRFYIVARLALVLILPILVYVFLQVAPIQLGLYVKVILVAVAAGIAILGVDAFIARRQSAVQQHYRLIFPDMIDMLVVCVDAGLGLDQAFARIQPEIERRNRALGMNLTILGAETRAGRGMVDALEGFADRLSLDEATAFVIMLRQSLELGSDIGDTLRVFSNEMRAKRLLRAEETANKLPVKLVIPLGLFIFPVILMVVMVPVAIKLLTIMHVAE